MCVPADEEFAELLAGVGVPLIPIGQPWGSMVRPSAAGMPRRTAELIRGTAVALSDVAPGSRS